MSTTVIRSRLLGLCACIAVLAFLLGVPAVLIGMGATPSSSAFASRSLSAPDDGTLTMAVISLAAWAAWAVFAVTLLLAISARIRGVQVRHVPGLGLPQYGAGQLVAAAALLFVAVPAITVVAAPRAVANTTATAPATQPAAPRPHIVEPPVTVHADVPAPPTTENYVVKRGDSLWKIAQQQLGDPTRYTELEALNQHQLGDRPDFLTPGTVLQIPAPSASPQMDGTYVVRPGDSLTGIADSELGNPADATEIFNASRSIEQPDGERLTDPDLIQPGWHLAIPDHPRLQHSVAPAPHAEPSPERPIEIEPSAPSSAQPDVATNPVHASAASHHEASPRWLLPGLTGAGSLLAGSLYLAFRAQRRSQLRFRRPGHIPVPVPATLLPAETTAWATGLDTAARVEALDRALRALAQDDSETPCLMSVRLTDTHIDLTLAEPAALPSPWTGTDTHWSLQISQAPDERADVLAPYPLMVSLGQTDDGALLLLNLEQTPVIAVTGDPERTLALARHITAELVLNPWTTLVDVDALGFGAELAHIDSRFRHRTDSRFLDDLTSTLQTDNPQIDPDQYRAVIAAASTCDSESAGKLAKILDSYPGRTATALILVDGEPPIDHTRLRIDVQGRLTASDLDIDVSTAGLSETEARACAELMALTQALTDASIPASTDPAALADQGGALLPVLTQARPDDGPAGPASLLPEATAVYDPTGATKADVDELAPLATNGAEAKVREADPNLDDDLARWQSPRLLAPQLTLLGPAKARTMGDATKIANRKPHYLAVLTYLTLHPEGVTASQIANAFDYTTDRARNDLSAVRHWLGKNPHTGEPYLPPARQARNLRTEAPYVVSGVLSDLDLFRRLRTRGQSRGAAGIDDLVTALSLVSGEPFEDMRSRSWAWLFEGERLDHILAAAIVDTAHVVCVSALADGDIERARWAAETGHLASPYDEVARLDQHAVATAAGDLAEAARIARDEISNRTDDDYGPLDVSARTNQVMRQIQRGSHRIKAVG